MRIPVSNVTLYPDTAILPPIPDGEGPNPEHGEFSYLVYHSHYPYYNKTDIHVILGSKSENPDTGDIQDIVGVQSVPASVETASGLVYCFVLIGVTNVVTGGAPLRVVDVQLAGHPNDLVALPCPPFVDRDGVFRSSVSDFPVEID